MKRNLKLTLIVLCLFSFFGKLKAQDIEAKLKLEFIKDSVKTCNVYVTSSDTVARNVEVLLFVKRLYSQMQIGDAVSTDENGMATFEFPNNIPADSDGKLIVIAKIEDNEIYANTEISQSTNWGIPRTTISGSERSLSGSRENAPIYFIVVANSVILLIWGTLIYVILQIFKIRKLASPKEKIIINN